MNRKSFAQLALVTLFLLISADNEQLTAANMRSFIEGVRRKAPVVYVGSVREVRQLARTKFDIKARAVVDVLAVMRSPATNPREATIEYSSYDEKTPLLEGVRSINSVPGLNSSPLQTPSPPPFLLDNPCQAPTTRCRNIFNHPEDLVEH